jgi:N-ethylmaleimide reductase
LEDVSHLPHYLNEITPYFRKIYKGILMTNGGFDAQSGKKIISDGHADIVAYGKSFISNPDLVEKFEKGVEITQWDSGTFYTQGTEGYIDY